MARRRQRHRTNGKRRALIEKVARVLRTGMPTVFALEGRCRSGLRAMFCLEGDRWASADLEAGAIVEAALREIGAQRPTWYEGQREYTGHEERLYCANPKCTKPIEREPGETQYRIFCSTFCRNATQNLRYAQDHRAEAKAISQAWRDARRAAATPKPCEWCSRLFQPLALTGKPEPRFCSRSCAASSSNSKRTESFGSVWPKRPAAPAAPPQPCEECGTMFRPRWKGNRFCGITCRNRANAQKRRLGSAPVFHCQAAE